MDCGAYERTEEKIKHHPSCVPGEAKKKIQKILKAEIGLDEYGYRVKNGEFANET